MDYLNEDRRISNIKIPLWLVTLVLLFTVASFASLFFYGEKVYNYQLVIADTGQVSSSTREVQFQYGEWPQLTDPDFFNQVGSRLIAEKANFIVANLSSMKLAVYKAGVKDLEVPILTKGKPGSWWETPAGLYKIESKKKSHYSSFGHVYQPWSMVFQGNFFIHGWPTYEDGSPVASTYSGGCIRLSTADAKAVYDSTGAGLPVLVYEKDFGLEKSSYNVVAPNINAQAYLASDLRNNFVFSGANTTEVKSVASLTKLVTALVAVEYLNLDQSVTITQSDIVKTSKQRLFVGQKVKIYDLLFPLLLESSNEAAETLANALGKDRFVSLMNSKAESLGMKNTYFVDASGAGSGNVSTAEDLFMLARYIYNNRSFIFKITTGELVKSAYGQTVFSNLGNFNKIIEGGDFVGGKVGQTTAAGETSLSVVNINVKTSNGNVEKRPVVIVVLGSKDRSADATKIYNYINNSFNFLSSQN